MDDKQFIFFILIPGLIFLVNYFLLRNAPKGKILFFSITSVLIVALSTYILIVRSINMAKPGSHLDLGGALTHLAIIYLTLIAYFTFSIIYRTVSRQ